MTDRELVASINGAPVGTLRDEQDVWSFEYAPEWVANPQAFPLSPALPLQSGRQVDGAPTRRPVGLMRTGLHGRCWGWSSIAISRGGLPSRLDECLGWQRERQSGGLT